MQPGVTVFSAVIAACGGQASTRCPPCRPLSLLPSHAPLPHAVMLHTMQCGSMSSLKL